MATKITGRISAGGFVAQERSQGANDAYVQNNNVQTISSRAYLSVRDYTENHFKFLMDLRDKHDFFDKLDRERLALTDANQLQVRQLYSAALVGGIDVALGRIAVMEAGDSFVDGVLVAKHWSTDVSSGVFAGLNPKRPDQTYTQYNPDSAIFGLHGVLNKFLYAEGNSLYIDNAYVVQTVKAAIDREFWYETASYHWAAGGFLSQPGFLQTISYLDFVPNVELQNGSVLLDQKLDDKWSGLLNAYTVDVIQYRRLQSVRETLAPAPYHEASVEIRYDAPARYSIEAKTGYGSRETDDYSRFENTLRLNLPQVVDSRLDAYTLAGYRRNFQSHDVFSRTGIVYSSRLWEYGIDFEWGWENYENGALYHPLIAQATLSHQFEAKLFADMGVEQVTDERASISSFFFKVTYRYGSEYAPPGREGDRVRGTL